MAIVDQRTLLFSGMEEFLGQALQAARRDGFSTLIVGNSYAVITGEASLDDVLDGCLDGMMESVLRREGPRARP